MTSRRVRLSFSLLLGPWTARGDESVLNSIAEEGLALDRRAQIALLQLRKICPVSPYLDEWRRQCDQEEAAAAVGLGQHDLERYFARDGGFGLAMPAEL
ncbi:hypothetical protein M431DRAFT_512485, partial [Trichoderma harzianum CBS 226.95]